jgi:peptide/nickel transport system permease protein
MLVTLVVLSAVLFFLERYSDANPVHVSLGLRATPKEISAANKSLGFTGPVYMQYLRYLGGLFLGRMGTSIRTHDSVGSDLAASLPASIELMTFALLLATIGGLVLGLAAGGRWRGSGILRGFIFSAGAIPVFLLGLLLPLVFYGKLGWLPASGETSYANAPTGPTGFMIIDALSHRDPAIALDVLRHMIMPAICLAVLPAVAIGRAISSALRDTLSSDYIRTARAKGKSEVSILFRHALRNCFNGGLSIAGLSVGFMFGNLAIIETIFSYPGVGYYFAQSIAVDDFPAITGVALVGSVIYLLSNLIVDLVQVWADPRILL